MPTKYIKGKRITSSLLVIKNQHLKIMLWTIAQRPQGNREKEEKQICHIFLLFINASHKGTTSALLWEWKIVIQGF